VPDQAEQATMHCNYLVSWQLCSILLITTKSSRIRS